MTTGPRLFIGLSEVREKNRAIRKITAKVWRKNRVQGRAKDGEEGADLKKKDCSLQGRSVKGGSLR